MIRWQDMTLEHLGDNATAADLAAFKDACRVRQQRTGETDEAVAELVWNNGDWSFFAARDLDELFKQMLSVRGTDDNDPGLGDWSNLPVFSKIPYGLSTVSVWSWDDDREIYGTCQDDLCIQSRRDMPTDADVAKLRDEAGVAGDLPQVAICDAALSGDLASRVECARVIAAARP